MQCAYCPAKLGTQAAINDHFVTYHKMHPAPNLEITATDDLVPLVFIKVQDT